MSRLWKLITTLSINKSELIVNFVVVAILLTNIS